MKLAELQNGTVKKFIRDSAVNDQQIIVQDLETKEREVINKEDVIRIIEVAFTFLELLKLVWSTVKKVFPKKEKE